MWSCCKEYPGARISELPQPEFLNERYSVFCQKFEIGGQSGTYIESKAHVEAEATPVSDYPVSEFFFDCSIIRVSRKKANEKVTRGELEACSSGIRPAEAVLIDSGWHANWFSERFVPGSPFISREAGLWLVEKGIKLLGADFPRFDNPGAPEFPWDRFWERVKFVLAPVVNLGGVKKDRVRLIALPLKIRKAAATPVRAVVVE